MQEVKPCKCGGKPKELYSKRMKRYYIECKKCRKTTYTNATLEQTIKEWNQWNS